MFNGLARKDGSSYIGGILYGLGDNRRTLGLVANEYKDGRMTEGGYYEMSEEFKLVKKEDSKTAGFIQSKFAIPQSVITMGEGSVLITDDAGRRWRLPLGTDEYRRPTDNGQLRICREVATERDLFSCMGTFYELPAENADGYAKIRPVATHPFFINDYASYRGMLVMTGVTPEDAEDNPHVVVSEDGKAAVWVGTIDDLWEMGKPVGQGGPWKQTQVKANVPSDPYLIAFYDKKTLTLKQESDKAVNLTVEVDPTGNGDWMVYETYRVEPGKEKIVVLPDELQARWIRFVSDADTQATAWLVYE